MAVELRQAADEIRRGPRQARLARRAARPYGVRLDVPGDPVAADAQPAPAGAEGKEVVKVSSQKNLYVHNISFVYSLSTINVCQILLFKDL